METIGLRLREYFEYTGVKRKDFCETMDIPYNSLTQILGGTRNVSSDVLDKIFTFFPRLNARWLISGQGPIEYSPASYYLDSTLEKSTIAESRLDFQKQSDAFIESLTEEKLDKILDDFIQKDDVRETFKKMMKESLGMVPEKLTTDGK